MMVNLVKSLNVDLAEWMPTLTLTTRLQKIKLFEAPTPYRWYIGFFFQTSWSRWYSSWQRNLSRSMVFKGTGTHMDSHMSKTSYLSSSDQKCSFCWFQVSSFRIAEEVMWSVHFAEAGSHMIQQHSQYSRRMLLIWIWTESYLVTVCKDVEVCITNRSRKKRSMNWNPVQMLQWNG